jgi:outer membrane lipoprotein-sorting protein
MVRTGVFIAIAAALLPMTAAVRAQEEAPPAAGATKTEAPAPPARVRPEISPELRHVLDKLDESNAKLVDVQANVTYTRVIPLLDDKRKSKGDLVFKKPNLLVMALKRPRNEEVRTNGHTWWVVNHNDKQVQVYQAAAEGEGGSSEAAFLAFGYGRSSEELLKDYDVELLDVKRPEDPNEPTLYRLKFTPVERPGERARYAAIEVVVDDKLWLPCELVLHERGEGVVHVYELSKIRINKGVKDDEFEYKPPSGYHVRNMEEP